jgi:RimK family alpha-L-glutamate ligase
MRKNKISIVAKTPSNWENNQIVEHARKRGMDVEITQFTDLNNFHIVKDDLGEIIVWRSSDLDKIVDRNLFMHLTSQHTVINDSLMKFPALAHKFFQQKYIAEKTSLQTIPTFRFRSIDSVMDAINETKLKYPFIVKPNLGARGEGILLINSENEISNLPEDIYEYVFQNFIRNTGDYRVFVLGGKAVGVMKRVAKEGEYLNNFSKGGSVHFEQDQKIIEYLEKEAPRVSAVFDLKLCGVDFIYDEDEKLFKFLEVNTAPQWQGLVNALQKDITDEIIDYAIRLNSKDESSTSSLVHDCYELNQSNLGSKIFHYNSRMYLWTKEDKYKARLEAYRSKYANLSGILDKSRNSPSSNKKKSLHDQERAEYFEKYPKLRGFNEALFKYLFAYTIYDIDESDELGNSALIDEMSNLARQLLEDKEALKTLSTFAINYLYLLRFFLRSTGDKIFEVSELLSVIEEFKHEINKENTDLYIYFATHCIIGESAFYSRRIESDREVYLELLKKVEEVIHQGYFNITLDNKCEFLVCCRLVGYSSFLEPIIQNEAEMSLSPIDNYIVDTVNSETRRQEKKTFLLSEHRNVLYIMANTEPKF